MFSLKSNNQNQNFIFKGQPHLKNLKYFGRKPFNLRSAYSPLIIFDLILNTPQYFYSIYKTNVVFFHTPFLIFHHCISLLLGKKSYLILHDFYIPYPLIIFLKFLKPKNIFCASEVLSRKFKFLSYTRTLNPYYSTKELSNLLEKNDLDFQKKSNLVFLGNINKVKQIGKFSSLFNQFIIDTKSNLCLSIYGQIINKDIFYQIKNLNSEIIKINKPVLHKEVDYLLRNFKYIIIPSESEVFPLVYFEALKANIIPLVNNIDFFNLIAGENKKHIFELNQYQTVNKVFIWAENLEQDSYMNYINRLKLEFVKYYKKHNNKDIFS